MDFNPTSGRPAAQQPPSGPSAPQFPGTSDQYQGMSQGGTMQQLYAQQRQQQLIQMQQQPGAATAAQSQLAAPQNVPAAAAASASTSQSAQIRTDPKRQMVPPPFPAEYLGDLSKYSVGALCLIGKEIVSELTIRAGTLFSLLKPEKQSAQDPLWYIEYNNKLFEQLAQIRILIGERMTGKEVPLARLYESLQGVNKLEPAPVPTELEEMEKILKENKAKLSDLSCDLKFLDWTAAVSDPGHLKRVDKMHNSRDTVHH